MTLKERTSTAIAIVSEGAGWGWAWLISAFKWCLAPLCDSWDGLSLNRFMAILFAIAATHGRFAHDSAITGWDIAAMVIAGSLAFGKDVWLAYIERKKDADAHA